MDDTNPYAAPEAPVGDIRARRAAQQGLTQAIRRGAWVGLKWTTLIIGPVAILLLLLGLGLLGFEVVSGRGVPSLADQRTRALLFGPFGFYLSSCLWGVIIGAVLAPMFDLHRRDRPRIGD